MILDCFLRILSGFLDGACSLAGSWHSLALGVLAGPWQMRLNNLCSREVVGKCLQLWANVKMLTMFAIVGKCENVCNLCNCFANEQTCAHFRNCEQNVKMLIHSSNRGQM